MDKSCSNCLYGNLHLNRGYWEFTDDYDIDCNYPNEGNFGKDVNEIDYAWNSDSNLVDIAENCDSYTPHFYIDIDYDPSEKDYI
jgi:hypothetical protein